MKKKILTTFLALQILLSIGISPLLTFATEAKTQTQTLELGTLEQILTAEDSKRWITATEVKNDIHNILLLLDEYQYYPTDWITWARSRLENITDEKDITDRIEKLALATLTPETLTDVGSVTRSMITVRAVQELPDHFRIPGKYDRSYDLHTPFMNIPKDKYWDRPNMASWMLIALNNVSPYKLTNKEVVKLRDELIDNLVYCSSKTGGWGLGPNPNGVGIDVTGFVLYALHPYIDRPEVKKEVDKAIDYMKRARVDNVYGEFDNSMTIAMMIWGLCSVGEDVLSEAHTYNGKNLIQELYKYKDGYRWKWKIDGQVDSWATEQVYVALLEFISSRVNKHSIDFNDFWVMSDLPQTLPETEDPNNPTPPVDPEIPEPPINPEEPNPEPPIEPEDPKPEPPIKPEDPKPEPPIKPEPPTDTGNTNSNNTTTTITTTNNNSTTNNSTTNNTSTISNTTNHNTSNVTNNHKIEQISKKEEKSNESVNKTDPNTLNLTAQKELNDVMNEKFELLLASQNKSTIDPIFIKIGLAILAVIAFSLATLAITSIVKIIPKGDKDE
ncbi:MAG: hypothetical protein ACRCYE_13355 [Sarcina sp.]